ncbi:MULTISPECIES: tail assembly chaperone [unclassified Enterococcus]|uniref:tail assembly chaperone n=1 Tax=unclassified Enterococcus TaxID=2608891 RepID=UPI001CE168DC|nr:MULTISPECIES: tail assembly chaperone [unclassified Enterococcus]MCA5012408.1 hypothetical protein [Enterococcus sp. S23]MCA5015659.1 hypothetical protein [Enterococcus sp. S22(2020)]
MELTINDKLVNFKFGYGFLKEVNQRYSVERGGMKLKLGVGAIISNLLLSDVDTLFETLLIANLTEKPRVQIKDLEAYVEEHGTQTLFEVVIEELKKSEYTAMMVNKMLEEAEL